MEKIAQLINNGMTLLGRKIDSLAMELRRKSPPPNTNISVDIGDNVSKAISDVMKESIAGLKMPEFNGFPEFPKYPDFPEIPTPQVTVNVPEIKLPIINIPETVVNVPPAQITVQPTPVEFPKEMKVEGMDKLIAGVTRETEDKNIFDEVTSKSPLAVMIVDKKGRQIDDFGTDITGPSTVSLRVGTTLITEDSPLPVTVDGFAIPMFDQQIIDETNSNNITIVYKRSGVIVATKTISILGLVTTITVV